jgi:hypothetical protein
VRAALRHVGEVEPFGSVRRIAASRGRASHGLGRQLHGPFAAALDGVWRRGAALHRDAGVGQDRRRVPAVRRAA